MAFIIAQAAFDIYPARGHVAARVTGRRESASVLAHARRWCHETIQADLRRLSLEAETVEIMVSGF